jgi:hypothetical protein
MVDVVGVVDVVDVVAVVVEEKEDVVVVELDLDVSDGV